MKKSFYLMIIAVLAMPFASVAFAADSSKEILVFNPVVPEDGSVEEFFAFIENVQTQKSLMGRTYPTSRDEYVRGVIMIGKACFDAADKILAKDSLTEKQIADAVKCKIDAVKKMEEYDTSFRKEYPPLVDLCKNKGLNDLAEELIEKLDVYKYVDDFKMACQSKNKDDAQKILDKMIEKAEIEGKKISIDLANGLESVLPLSREIFDIDQVNKRFTKVIDLFLNSGNSSIVWRTAPLRRQALVGNEMLVGGTFIDDTEYKAEDYAGKTVLIDFWATWCPPCRGEIPNVKKLYAFYHEKGFEIIGISSDSSVETLKSFIEKEEMPWKQIMSAKALLANNQTMGSYYGVNGIPTMILIGPDGKVVTVHARGQALEDALAAIYGPMPKDEK